MADRRHLLGMRAAPLSTVVFLHDPAATSACLAPERTGSRTVLEFTPTNADDASENVAAAIRGYDSYILAGEGSAAMLAAELARRAEDGEAGLEGLTGVSLIGASLGIDAAISRRVGVLRTPALLVGARDDAARDANHQLSLVAPHFAIARLRMVASLTPTVVAEALFDDGEAGEAIPSTPVEPDIDDAYATLIRSDRVTHRTREVLLRRAARLPPSPVTLTPPLLAILRAAVALILPVEHAFPGSAGRGQVDIARRIDQSLGGGSDGWRYAALPSDAVAAELGLRTLDDAARATCGRPFVCLEAAARQELLDHAERGARRRARSPSDVALGRRAQTRGGATMDRASRDPRSARLQRHRQRSS